MLFHGIDPHPVANPDFIGVTGPAIRVAVHPVQLPFQFIRLPQIVRIQKTDPLPTRHFQSPVAGVRNPMVLFQLPVADLRQTAKDVLRSIRRPVVDDDQLPVRAGLAIYRIHRFQ